MLCNNNEGNLSFKRTELESIVKINPEGYIAFFYSTFDLDGKEKIAKMIRYVPTLHKTKANLLYLYSPLSSASLMGVIPHHLTQLNDHLFVVNNDIINQSVLRDALNGHVICSKNLIASAIDAEMSSIAFDMFIENACQIFLKIPTCLAEKMWCSDLILALKLFDLSSAINTLTDIVSNEICQGQYLF